MRPATWVLATLFIILLPACATMVLWEWKVTRFHSLDAVAGKTFVMLPVARGLENSLEYQTYAKLAADRLAACGMVRRDAKEFGHSDFVVGLDYGVGNRADRRYYNDDFEVVASPPITVIGAGGSFAIMQPPPTAVATRSSQTVTTYRQFVRILIHDGRPNADGKYPRRFEGTAEWDGFTDDMTKIVPSGLKALLADFPGKSGTSGQVLLTGLEQTP